MFVHLAKFHYLRNGENQLKVSYIEELFCKFVK